MDDGRNGSRLRGGRRRRRVPYLVAGVLLVVASTAGFVVISVEADQRVPVLALARPVVVGQVLTSPDLREVHVAADADVDMVSVADAPRVVGRVAATSLPAGSLLAPGVLGSGPVPGPGRAITAMALKAGQFPPELSAGARVSVVAVPASTTALAATASVAESVRAWPATVISVTARANEQTTVVSVELGEGDARQVAAIPVGQVSVVMVGAGGGR